MNSPLTLTKPKIVIRNGRPTEIILKLKEFKEILERLEDIYDLSEIQKLKKKKLSFRKIEDFLREYAV